MTPDDLPDAGPSPDLRDRLTAAARGEDGALRHGLWVSFLGAYALEVTAGCGADWFGVDLQHGDLEPRDLPALLRVAEARGVPLLARTPSHDPAVLGRLLDAGVDGLVVPLVETAAQARSLVAAARTPPHGTRSTGGCRTSLGVTRAPTEPLLLPMIETATGLADAAEILAVPGVDGVFVGPYDLTLSAGFPSPGSPETIEALRTVIGLAREAGKIAGFMAGTDALRAVAPEADLVALDTDVAALRTGLTHVLG